MSVDTRDRRASCIGVGLPVPRLQQNPSGFIRKAGRHLLALLYSGIIIQQFSPVFSNSNSSTRLLSSSSVTSILS